MKIVKETKLRQTSVKLDPAHVEKVQAMGFTVGQVTRDAMLALITGEGALFCSRLKSSKKK
jgi:hypothetical protein